MVIQKQRGRSDRARESGTGRALAGWKRSCASLRPTALFLSAAAKTKSGDRLVACESAGFGFAWPVRLDHESGRSRTDFAVRERESARRGALRRSTGDG